MKNIDILPLDGVHFDGAKIRFGASESEVRAVLGEPESTFRGSLYYFCNELRLDLVESGVEFIEFLGGPDGALQPTIYGAPAFDTDADTLYKLLAEKNDGDIDDRENGYFYAFLNLSIGVYRESIPESVDKMIDEAAGEGVPMNAEEIAKERRKSSFWATIGIGCAGYYRKP